jgi:cohesin complex subunit SCC1
MDFDDADNFALGPSDGIGSQDFLDLGLNFGDADETMSVEVGRDAGPPRAARESLDSHFLGRAHDDFELLSNKSRENSEHPNVDMGFGPDLEDMEIDLGLDFGPVPGDREKTPGQTTRACMLTCSKFSDLSDVILASPLSEPPKTPPDTVQTPLAEEKAKRKQKDKKAIVDNETELRDGPGARGRGRRGGLGSQVNKDVSGIVTDHHYLPRSTLVMQLLEIRNDPLSYFMPTKVTPEGTFFYAGPPGLAPELAEMFMRPAIGAATSKKRASSPGKGPSKKRKVAGDEADDDEIEAARRKEKEGSVAPSIVLGSDVLGQASAGPGLEFEDTNMGAEDFQMDVGGLEVPEVLDIGLERARSKSAVPSERSRLSTPAVDNGIFDEERETFADASCPIALFDERASQSQPSEGSQSDGKDYSRNTLKALTVVRKELQPSADNGEEEKAMSFNEMSEKVCSPALSGFSRLTLNF